MEVQKTTPSKPITGESNEYVVEIIYLVFAILVSCFFAFRSDLGFFGKIMAAVVFSIFGFVGILKCPPMSRHEFAYDPNSSFHYAACVFCCWQKALGVSPPNDAWGRIML